MLHRKNSIVSILILISIFVWRAETTQAISCLALDAERLQSGLEEFEAVFIGEVVAVDYPNPDNVQNGTVHYRVDRVFKGVVPEHFFMEASSWGDPFPGYTYLMFIDSLENPSFDSPDFAASCRNTVVDNIDFDYAVLLGDGYAPIAGDNSSDNSPEEDSFMNLSTLAILSAFIALSVIGTVFGMRFMNRNRS